MNQKDVAQLERLLSELADEGASRELVEKIEALLIDQPELQDHYWSWMDVHVALGVERTAILGESETISQLSYLPEAGTGAESFATQPIEPRQQALSRKWFTPAILVAACLGLSFWALPGSFWEHSPTTLSPDSASVAIEGTWRIPKITRVSWEGPFFAGPEHADNSASPKRAGLVSLGIVDGLSANGYVLQLEPGASAELLMAADAYAENNLTVTELKPDGTPVLRNVSFNNFGAGVLPTNDARSKGTRRYGLIGTWTVFNDSDRPKHYLINGIHKVDDPDSPNFNSDSEFLLSDMVVLLEESDLVLIGWDDGGVDPNNEINGVDSDGDYDDITVVIRITEGSDSNPNRSHPHRIISWPSNESETPQSDCSTKHEFSLLPGDFVAIKVASHATFTNSFYLMNVETDEVLWSARNTRPGTMNLGAVAVLNTGERMMNLAVFCEHSSTPPNVEVEWKCSEMSIVHEQPSCTILGFEDLYEGDDADDFDDIKVTMLSVSSDRINLIESPRGSFVDQESDELGISH